MLWNHLAQTKIPEASWILVGDFNNIEYSNHKQGSSSKTSIGMRESEAWNMLLMWLGVWDAFHIGAFTRRSNKPSHGQMLTMMTL